MSDEKPACPRFGLTVRAPWGAAIAWGGKNVENRGPEVARAIGAYRGRIALTASAGHEIGGRHVPLMCSRAGVRQMRDDVATDILSTIADLNTAGVATWSRPVTLGDIEAMAGRWFATARVVAVLNPARNIGPWASLGSFGIVLEDVHVLERFEPATGALGFFAFGRCADCDRPTAMRARHRCPGRPS